MKSMPAAGLEQLKIPMVPIRLTPRTPYVWSAALVFANAHLVSPSDDLVFIGSTPVTGAAQMPHPGAGVAVWFRIPAPLRKFDVEFSCFGGYPGVFTLESSLPSAEPVFQPAGDTNVLISRNFISTGGSAGTWEWFRVSNDESPWTFTSVEITEHP
jgi:hypothetical protein